VEKKPETKPSLSERLKGLFAEYGRLAIIIYFSIFAAVLAGFAIAIRFGVAVEGTAGTAGTLGAAWVATKLTQPLRIGATLLLTPLVANVLVRVRKTAPPAGPAEAAPVDTESPDTKREPDTANDP
jgi:hypothetical protein